MCIYAFFVLIDLFLYPYHEGFGLWRFVLQVGDRLYSILKFEEPLIEGQKFLSLIGLR